MRSRGLALAEYLIVIVRHFGPADIPRLPGIGIDRWVLAFTLTVSLATTILFGLIPAIDLARPDVSSAIKGGAVSASKRGFGWTYGARSPMIIVQICVALVLAISGGLLIKSFRRLMSVHLGFDARNTLVMDIDLPNHRYPDAGRRQRFFSEIVERVSALPGVKAGGLSSSRLLSDDFVAIDFRIQGHPSALGNTPTHADLQIVSSNFIPTMGIRLVAGRYFAEADAHEGAKVAIVNQTLARRYWPAGDAIGQQLSIGWGGETAWRRVVGVVSDTKDVDITADPKPTIYIPYLQARFVPSMTLYVRTHSNPLALSAAIRRQVWAVDGDQPVTQAATVKELEYGSVAEARFRSILFAALAVLTLLIAAAGVYGAASYAVAQRSHEIAIRMALGAPPKQIVKSVLSGAVALAAAGTALGLAGAVASAKVLSSLLYHVSSTDPTIFLGAALLVCTAALSATVMPALRAARVDPAAALRCE